MNAGWMFLRTELRKRWRSWLALALIVGAFAGAVEAAAAGARRTDAAYPALLTWSRAPDLLAAWPSARRCSATSRSRPWPGFRRSPGKPSSPSTR